MSKPHRSIRLTLALEADTLVELVMALEQIGFAAARGELTTGSSGGCGNGYCYELLQNPEQTHDKYFAELREYLTATSATRTCSTTYNSIGKEDDLSI